MDDTNQKPTTGQMLADLAKKKALDYGTNYILDWGKEAFPSLAGSAGSITSSAPIATEITSDMISGLSNVPADLGYSAWAAAQPDALTAAASEMSGTGSTLSSSLGALSPYLGAAGTAAGAYGLYNTINAKQGRGASAIGGGLSGAGMGAGIGTMIAPGIGTLIGGGIGLLAGGGLGGLLGYKSTKVRNAERDAELASKDYTGWKDLYAKTQAGKAKADSVSAAQAPDFVGFAPDGTWVNNKFKQDPKASNLYVEDVWGSPDFFNNFGNDWLGKYSEADRRKIAQSELDAGQIESRKGGLYFKDDAKAKQIGLDAIAPKAESAATSALSTDPAQMLNDINLQNKKTKLLGLTNVQGFQPKQIDFKSFYKG